MHLWRLCRALDLCRIVNTKRKKKQYNIFRILVCFNWLVWELHQAPSVALYLIRQNTLPHRNNLRILMTLNQHKTKTKSKITRHQIRAAPIPLDLIGACPREEEKFLPPRHRHFLCLLKSCYFAWLESACFRVVGCCKVKCYLIMNYHLETINICDINISFLDVIFSSLQNS